MTTSSLLRGTWPWFQLAGLLQSPPARVVHMLVTGTTRCSSRSRKSFAKLRCLWWAALRLPTLRVLRNQEAKRMGDLPEQGSVLSTHLSATFGSVSCQGGEGFISRG